MDETIPRRRHIGPYRLEKPLGAGGMGEVHQAWDERLHRWVAVKRLRQDLETTPERRWRFRREARAAAGLRHPAIVQIHDILEDETGDAIVMEYVEGRPLSELIAAGELDGRFATSLARQIAEGLLHAHEHGIVHRDLKTENVMITTQGEARILDFGLARPLVAHDGDPSLTRDGALVGTVRAMSPEQAAGRNVDTRSDLFSLGVLLYEMFTGCSPFRGENALQVLHQILHQPPPPPRALRPELPGELGLLIERLLEKDPGCRPGDTRQVAEALAELADSAVLEGLQPAPPSTGGMPSSLGSDAAPNWRGPPPAPPATEMSPTETPQGVAPRRAVPGRAGWLSAAAILVVALAGVAAYFLTARQKTLRVLVLNPELTGSHDDAGIFAVGIREALVRTLLTLEGIEPLATKAAGPEAASPRAAALAVAADEVVTTRLDFRDGTCWISFRRLAGDARVLWSSEPFEAPVGPQYSYQLAHAVRSRFTHAYPRRRPRSGALPLEAREEDYATFLELQHRILSGQHPGERELQALVALTESSPRFFEAYLLAADAARQLRRLDEARALVERLRRLAPEDPRPVDLLLRIERRAGRLEEAQSALRQLELLVPGDLRVLKGRARLAELRGEPAKAIQLWRQVVEARSSWQSLYNLAAVELTHGETEASRGHLEHLLEISPKNPLGMALLGQLEMLNGDLPRAEALFRTLTESHPRTRSNFTNLATVHYLRRDYEAAVPSLRRALELAPRNRVVRLNLADAELKAGRPEVARALYVELLEELDRKDAEELDPRALMTQAQCLARLERPLRAVEIVHTALRRTPQNSEVAFQAALVYALVGDRNSALASAVEARRLGIQPVWFQVPEFDFLHTEWEFRRRVLENDG